MTFALSNVFIAKFWKMESISHIFSGRDGMKLEINQKKKSGKNVVS